MGKSVANHYTIRYDEMTHMKTLLSVLFIGFASSLLIAESACPINTDKGLKGKVRVLERSTVTTSDGGDSGGYCWVHVDFGGNRKVKGLAHTAKLCSNLVRGSIIAEVFPGCCEPRSTEFPCGAKYEDKEGSKKISGGYSILK